MKTDHGCCRILGTDMGFDCSLGQGITVASIPPISAHSFTVFASLSQPLSTGHGPPCIFISSIPHHIFVHYNRVQHLTMVHFHWQVQSKSVYECIYGEGSEEDMGKKGKEKNLQTLSLWHVNSLEKYNYYIYSFSISFFFK